jgi:beta-lactamase regulating signal transducer with metallopeptidase domain
MNDLLQLWLSWRALLGDTILYVVLGSTALLLLCAGTAWLMARASAAARHMLWLLAFAGLALGLASLLVPHVWTWRVLRTSTSIVLLSPPDEVGIIRAPAPTPQPVYTQRAPRPVMAPEDWESKRPRPRAEARQRHAPQPMPLIRRLTLGWLLGSVLAMAPLLAGMLALRRLRAQSRLVTDAEALRELEALRAASGLRRPVELLVSKFIEVPLTWGVWRPAIVLPPAVLCGPPETLRAVLLHELAHIRRDDFASQTFARATAALFWFQPLAWLALRRLRLESEMACDDIVVQRQQAPADYAETLLALARRLHAPAADTRTAVAMAQRSHLELRLRGILDRTRARAAASRRLWAPLFVVLSLGLIALRVVRPAAALAAEKPSSLPVELRAHLQKLAERGPADFPRLATQYVECELLTERKLEKTGEWVMPPEPSRMRCWIDRRGMADRYGEGLRYRVDSAPAVHPTDSRRFSIADETVIHTQGKERRYDQHDRMPMVHESAVHEVWSAGEQFLLALTDLHFQARSLLRGDPALDEELRAEMVDDPLGRLVFVERTFQSGTHQRTRYWLDPAHGYALRRYELAFSNVVMITNEVQELMEVKPGLWLPARAVQVGDTQRNHFRFLKREVEVEIPDSTFVFSPIELPYTTEPPKVLKAATDHLTFTVIDRATRQPLPNSKLRVTGEWRCGQPDPGFDLQTDAAGKARVPLPQSTAHSLNIRASAAGYVPTVALWRSNNKDKPIELPHEYTLDVEPATEISGRTLDEQQRPIAGAKVELSISGGPITWTTFAKVISRRETLTTDEEGRWKCGGMPSDLKSLYVRLQHPDFLSDNYVGEYRQRSPLPLSTLRDGSSYLIMAKGVTVAGRVTDAAGEPIAGAEVKQGRDRWGSSFPMTKTAPDGSFRFAHAEPGEMCLTVQAKGHAPETQTIVVEGGREDLVFALPLPQRLRGRLVDKAGKPLKGVGVYADTWRVRNRALNFSVETDAEGRFTWADAPADAVLFDFVGAGVEFRDVSLQPGDVEQVVRVPRK